jgi:hypothetical protein
MFYNDFAGRESRRVVAAMPLPVVARNASDQAVHFSASGGMDCFAALAMTRRRRRNTRLSSPRMRGSSTPRLIRSITAASGILGHPLSRVTTTEYGFAISRRVASEVCFRISRPLVRGRREDRVRAAPAVSCAICALGTRTRAYRYSGSIPAFPAQWLYGLLRALPGERLSCHRRRARMNLAQLNASTAASEPHDFAVRFLRLRLAHSASIASHRTFVTMANAPHLP